MTWTTDQESAQAARQLLDEEGRELGTVPYELALYALVRTGVCNSHRVLAAAFLNMHDSMLDTQSGNTYTG